MDKKTNSSFNNEIKFEWNGIEINMISFLHLEDMMGFVDYVTSLCFTDDGEYQPELKDFAVRCAVIEYYTDFVLPSGTSEKYEFVYQSSLFEDVIHEISNHNACQFNDILASIDKKVKMIAQANIEMVNAQMNMINKEFSNLVSQIRTLFAGVTDKDISSMFKLFSDGKFDSNEIIKSLIESKEGK